MNVKEVLKVYHKGSPFKGTHLVTKAEEKENAGLASNRTRPVAGTATKPERENTCGSEDIRTVDNTERGPYTRDSKAEGSRCNINASLVNKNINYSQKMFELQKDAGEYQQTSFENLRTEYFLLNGNTSFEEAPDSVDDAAVELELQSIYRKLGGERKDKEKEQDHATDICGLADEDDPIPHMLRGSELTASKNVWKSSFSTSVSALVSPRSEPNSAAPSRRGGARFWDLRLPLLRKLLVCKLSGNEGRVLLDHALSASGYLSAPKLMYGTSNVSQPDASDRTLPMNSILSAQILSSMCQTAVVLITCGFEHCSVLTRSGTVATWGYGGSGCLGQGNYVSYTCPKLVKGLPANVVHVESGAYHTAAVSSAGEMYVWGRSDVGQLGLPTEMLARDSMVRGVHDFTANRAGLRSNRLLSSRWQAKCAE